MIKIRSVLLVCTGNSCRSVMAEGLLKKALKDLGKDTIRVTSAGVSAMEGAHPTRETIEVMRNEGIDVSGFKSRLLTEKMIVEADLILVMAAHHMDDIIRLAPEAASKTHILKQFASGDEACACEDLDIEDPIGRSVEFYGCVLGSIKTSVKKAAELL